MSTNAEAGTVRRTQAERSTAMRIRLLDATAECLVSYGYSGTTTQRVAEMAGVTRGAQVHHFRSKEDLVVAAIEHLALQRAQSAVREVGRVQASPDPVAMVLDYLWEAHQGPIFIATLELWVASRTDPVLAGQIVRVEPIVNSALIAAIGQLMPDHPAPKELRDLTYTAMDALRGILVASFVDRDSARARRRWDRVCAQLRGNIAATLRAEPAQ